MATTAPLDDEVIDLEPTQTLSLNQDGSIDPLETMVARPVVARGSMSSLSGELDLLRRRRLAASALLLGGMYGLLFFWNLRIVTTEATYVWLLLLVRSLLAFGIATALISPIQLSTRAVRALEGALFGGLILLLMISQYNINLTLMERNDVAGVISFIKNGVIQMVLMMFLYGTFIPNKPGTAAKVIFTMAAVPMLGWAFLTERPDLARATEGLFSVEQKGSNLVYMSIAASMAVFGAMVLNGLRVQLHEARKFGQYRLLRKIGAGGMGEVHLAEHQLLKRPCALKLIRNESGSDPTAVARFAREVQAAAQLAHPNTIQIYDYGHTDDGTFYYVMEFLRGLSLADLITRYGALSAGRTIYLFRQVCSGLAEAHALGLVHRDLKPANVFVAIQGGETDVAKVLDFGLVKLKDDAGGEQLTKDFTVSGTPQFMSPEQVEGSRTLDNRSDIYSLGVMLYHTLTGQPPFDGDTAFAVMMSQARDIAVAPSKIVTNIPADLERVVMKCMEKKAADRYQDVKELRDALEQCASAGEWNGHKADAWWEDKKMFAPQAPEPSEQDVA